MTSEASMVVGTSRVCESNRRWFLTSVDMLVDGHMLETAVDTNGCTLSMRLRDSSGTSMGFVGGNDGLICAAVWLALLLVLALEVASRDLTRHSSS